VIDVDSPQPSPAPYPASDPHIPGVAVDIFIFYARAGGLEGTVKLICGGRNLLVRAQDMRRSYLLTFCRRLGQQSSTAQDSA